ncbi:MAG: hypothetical protein ACFFAZ_14895 [Promethearchaeota archaeon]
MNLKRYFEPAGHILGTAPESKSFLLSSLVIVIFLRLLLLWGYHNLFHMTYLLIAFSFLQTTILSSFIMQKINDALTMEEHSAMKKSAILLGYIWSLILYMAVVGFWIIDLWQIESGVPWPTSDFTPDAAFLLIVTLLCVLHFPLTVSALYWQWGCFQPRDEDSKLVFNRVSFRNRGPTTILLLASVFVSVLGLKSAIEGEFLLPSWFNSLAMAISILLVMVVMTIAFYSRYQMEGT